MKRRTLAVAAAAAWIALLVAVAPAAAASTGLVLSLIRQELVRYGLLNADGTPAAGALSTTGDALSGAGTSGDPLAAASDLENLVDNWAIDSSGNASNLASVAQTGSVSLTGAGTVTQQGYLRRVYTYTGGLGAATTLTTSQCGAVICNTGATVEAYVNLPAATVGQTFTFYEGAGVGLRAVANGTDTIRVGETISSAGGYMTCSVQGSAVTLVCTVTGKWQAISGAAGPWVTA